MIGSSSRRRLTTSETTSRSGSATTATTLVHASANQATTMSAHAEALPYRVVPQETHKHDGFLHLWLLPSRPGIGRLRGGSSIPHSRNACPSSKTVGRNPNEGEMMTKVQKTEEQWRAELDPEQYHVLREKGTEAPFSGEYDHTFEPGTYRCAGCGAELFRSRDEVRLGLRVAGVLRAGRRGGGRRGDRHDLRDGAHRGDVLELRRPPRPRLPGRAGPDRNALLHQFGSTQLEEE